VNCRVSGVCAGLLALSVGSAHAGGYSIHVVGTAQGAWTDNLFSQADDPVNPPEADFYYQFRPGVMLTYETPRTVHQLSADVDAMVYQSNDQAWSLQYMLGWRGFITVSPRSEAGASAMFSHGQLAALTMQGAASDGTIDEASLAGDAEATFTSLDVGQNYAYTPTRELRLTQGARARRFETSAGETSTSGQELGLSAGADRGWKYTAVAMQLSSSLISLERNTGDDPTTDQVNVSAVLSWRRDFGPRWSSLVDAGMTSIVPLDEGDQLVLQPTVGGQVSYAPNWGTAGLQLRRSVAPNLYLAQNTISDSAIVNAWLPLPWLTDDPLLPKLTVQGTLGVQRSRLLDTRDGSIQSGFDLVAGDVALLYVPRDGVTVGARAQHVRQVADEDAVMDNVTSYDRTTFMVTVTGRFPDRLAAEVPLRSSTRVDRSDNTAVGDEVAPPAQAP
jgi:hypothetical protein